MYSRRQQIWPHFKTSLTSQKLLLATEKLCTLRTHIQKFPVRVSRLELSQNQCYVRYHTKLIFRISEFFAIFFDDGQCEEEDGQGEQEEGCHRSQSIKLS